MDNQKDSIGKPVVDSGPRKRGVGSVRAAYCDVDGTLAATTIVRPLIWFKFNELGWPLAFLWTLTLGIRGPWWMLLDWFNRENSNRAIYASYSGMDADNLKEQAPVCYAQYIKPRLFSEGLELLKTYRRDGVKIVLVTGGIDSIMRPLAAFLGAECIAPGLDELNGILTGAIIPAPLSGQRKANAIHVHAAENGVDLAQSYALGDSISDLQMLECVGHPIAVNPDGRLAKIATERGWRKERWRK